MKFRCILLNLFVLIGSVCINAQIPALNYLKNVLMQVDSVSISTIHYDESEMTLPFDVDNNHINTDIYILNSEVLTGREIKELTKNLKKLNSQIVLSAHYDIELNYYVEDSIISIVRMSSIMKSISIQNPQIKCEDHDSFSETECYFLGSTSKSLQKYITKLLKKKKLWNENESFYEW